MATKNIVVVGGSGDRSGANNGNGGAYRGSHTWSSFQGTNGDPLAVVSNPTISNNGAGKVRISKNGCFDISYVDLKCRIVSPSVYTNGHHWIIAATSDYIDLDLSYISDITLTSAVIGGALLGVNTPFTQGLVEGKTIIKISGGPYSGGINNDGYSSRVIDAYTNVPGSTTAERCENTVMIEGVRSDGVFDPDNLVVIDCSIGTATMGIGLNNYTGCRGFKIHSPRDVGVGGCSADRTPSNCIVEYNEIYGMSNTFTADGAISLDDVCLCAYNYIHDCVGGGIVLRAGSAALFNRIRKVSKNYISMNYGTIIGNELSMVGAGKSAIVLSEQYAQPFIVAGNTIDGGGVSDSKGIELSPVVDFSMGVHIDNNIISYCDVGIAINCPTRKPKLSINCNLYYGNAVNSTAQDNDTGEFPVFGDPLFKDRSAGDYTLQSDSPAIKSTVLPNWSY